MTDDKDFARELIDVSGIQEAETRLRRHRAVVIVSLWWSAPYVMGVLADGRTLVVSAPDTLPSETRRASKVPAESEGAP